MILSIITVNYNNVAGLRKTAESVIAQTFKDFEWIVIDGGSTDGSSEYLEKHSSNLAYWVSEKDKGIYNAMNKGVAKSKGDYLLFLNSGDWLFSDNSLEQCFYKKQNDDILYGEISFCRDGQEYRRSHLPEKLGMNFLAWNFIGHSGNCFIKRERLIEFPYDESLKIVSDWKFYLQSAFAGATFKHIDTCVCCYDLSGLSERERDLSWKERCAVFEECIPPIVKTDAKQNKIVEAYLANTSIEDFVGLRERHNILGKIITLAILLMKRIK